MAVKVRVNQTFQQIKETLSVCGRLLVIVWQTDRLLFAVYFVAMIIPGVIPFINIYIYKLIIDLVIGSLSSGGIDLIKFYPLLGLRLLTYFLQDASFATERYVIRLIWTKVPIELHQIVFKKISGLDVYYFENDKFRDLIEKARESISVRPQRLIDAVFAGMQSLIQFTIAFAALVHLNWFFVILILAISVPEFITQAYRSKIAWGIWSDNSPFRKRFHYLNHILLHHREVKEVKIFQLARKFLQELRDIEFKFYRENKSVATKSYFSNIIFNFLSTFVFIGIEVFVIFQTLSKKLTVGDIAFYSGVVSNFQNGLGGLFSNINTIFDNSLYVKNVFDILEVEPVVKLSENPVKLTSRETPSIEFKNVSFSYPDTTKKILNNFSLSISKGEKIAFVGENGAGKSTIIKLMLRFYDVTEGEILINGVNLKEIDLSSWYERIGVLFQDFNRYESSVKENIHYGRIDSRMDLKGIINASVSSGAHKMIEGFDKKYEQMLGRMFEGGLELSGGQWQKIALTRAFFRNAPVLVLDEPTAAIDAKGEAEIFNRVEKLSNDKTVIIISHRFSTVRNADKIYVIDNGKIVESGSHQQLMKLNGEYSTLFNLQAKGYR